MLALALPLLLWRLAGPCRPRREPPAEPISAGLRFSFPTAQTNLADTTSFEVFMPTASGRIESALYGSTRTHGQSGNFLPRFHKGIDIAPLARGRDGKPLDPVLAVAVGRVSYIQAAPGGSTYGRYVVLEHDDPVGVIYTLYAHLDEIAPGLEPGDRVARGETIGRMGHSASYRIPVQRAHLHFEIGVFLHAGFAGWLRENGLPDHHGIGHGWNLQAIDPLAVLLRLDGGGRRSMLDVLDEEPVAFTLLLTLDAKPDYFLRHPLLWQCGSSFPRDILLDVAEGGAPLAVRPAAGDLIGQGSTPRVVEVNEQVLGRNGRRLLQRQSAGEWRLSDRGRRWLSKLLFP